MQHRGHNALFRDIEMPSILWHVYDPGERHKALQYDMVQILHRPNRNPSPKMDRPLEGLDFYRLHPVDTI